LFQTNEKYVEHRIGEKSEHGIFLIHFKNLRMMKQNLLLAGLCLLWISAMPVQLSSRAADQDFFSSHANITEKSDTLELDSLSEKFGSQWKAAKSMKTTTEKPSSYNVPDSALRSGNSYFYGPFYFKYDENRDVWKEIDPHFQYKISSNVLFTYRYNSEGRQHNYVGEQTIISQRGQTIDGVKGTLISCSEKDYFFFTGSDGVRFVAEFFSSGYVAIFAGEL
jgi:hypothetical protein